MIKISDHQNRPEINYLLVGFVRPFRVAYLTLKIILLVLNEVLRIWKY